MESPRFRSERLGLGWALTETDGASHPARAPRGVRPGPGSARPAGWSPRPARGRLTRACAAGSPRREWGASASGAGGWAGVGTPSGAGGAAVSAGRPSRLPGLSCREGGGAGEIGDPGPRGPQHSSSFPGNPNPQGPNPSPAPGHARDPTPLCVRPKGPRPPARRPPPGDPLSQRAHPAPHPRFPRQGPRPGSPKAPPPSCHSHALAQSRLPGRAGSALGLGCACAALLLLQQPRGLGGRRLPSRQGLCGRSGRGQAGVPAPDAARAGRGAYRLPIVCVLCFALS